jgi:hypothetical protein
MSIVALSYGLLSSYTMQGNLVLTFWKNVQLYLQAAGVTGGRNFFVIKPNRCTNFTNLFWRETLRISHSSSVHHQEFINCTLSNGVCHTGFNTAFEQDQDGTAVTMHTKYPIERYPQ